MRYIQIKLNNFIIGKNILINKENGKNIFSKPVFQKKKHSRLQCRKWWHLTLSNCRLISVKYLAIFVNFVVELKRSLLKTSKFAEKIFERVKMRQIDLSVVFSACTLHVQSFSIHKNVDDSIIINKSWSLVRNIHLRKFFLSLSTVPSFITVFVFAL